MVSRLIWAAGFLQSFCSQALREPPGWCPPGQFGAIILADPGPAGLDGSWVCSLSQMIDAVFHKDATLVGGSLTTIAAGGQTSPRTSRYLGYQRSFSSRRNSAQPPWATMSATDRPASRTSTWSRSTKGRCSTSASRALRKPAAVALAADENQVEVKRCLRLGQVASCRDGDHKKINKGKWLACVSLL